MRLVRGLHDLTTTPAKVAAAVGAVHVVAASVLLDGHLAGWATFGTPLHHALGILLRLLPQDHLAAQELKLLAAEALVIPAALRAVDKGIPTLGATPRTAGTGLPGIHPTAAIALGAPNEVRVPLQTALQSCLAVPVPVLLIHQPMQRHHRQLLVAMAAPDIWGVRLNLRVDPGDEAWLAAQRARNLPAPVGQKALCRLLRLRANEAGKRSSRTWHFFGRGRWRFRHAGSISGLRSAANAACLGRCSWLYCKGGLLRRCRLLLLLLSPLSLLRTQSASALLHLVLPCRSLQVIVHGELPAPSVRSRAHDKMCIYLYIHIYIYI